VEGAFNKLDYWLDGHLGLPQGLYKQKDGWIVGDGVAVRIINQFCKLTFPGGIGRWSLGKIRKMSLTLAENSQYISLIFYPNTDQSRAGNFFLHCMILDIFKNKAFVRTRKLRQIQALWSRYTWSMFFLCLKYLAQHLTKPLIKPLTQQFTQSLSDKNVPTSLRWSVLKKCRFYTSICVNVHPTPSVFQQSTQKMANTSNMTYKSTTLRPKITVDSLKLGLSYAKLSSSWLAKPDIVCYAHLFPSLLCCYLC
jgi:hypothetical protein